MKCPKCGGTYVKIYGTFDGHQKIEFKPEDEVNDGDFIVVDSEPTDFSWDDHDEVECLECWHTGEVLQFEAAARKAAKEKAE